VIKKKCFFRSIISIAVILFSALIFTAAAFGEVVYIEETGFVLEPPIGWALMDATDSRWTFNDFTGDAFLQIKIWPGGEYESAEAMFDGVKQSINASGEGDTFDFYGREAVFGFVEFTSGGFNYTGYGLFADGEDFDLTILSFASSDRAALLNDYILSALDSFALSPLLMLNPGPVSRYYLASYNNGVNAYVDRSPAATVFEGQPLTWFIDNHAVEASQLMIEREAAILADFKPGTEEGNIAWERYYRMIYRDSYSRLDYPASLLKERLNNTGNAEDTPQRLLSWVQGFEYRRTEGSDIINPLSAAAFHEGDCDSRSLLYIILLNHYGIDSALMVSAVYSHAMAAVDVDGAGARIDSGGKGYLVAETTEQIGIGMIASDMADPAKWLVIPLMEKEPWN
jgi:hypothetical protein